MVGSKIATLIGRPTVPGAEVTYSSKHQPEVHFCYAYCSNLPIGVRSGGRDGEGQESDYSEISTTKELKEH